MFGQFLKSIQKEQDERELIKAVDFIKQEQDEVDPDLTLLIQRDTTGEVGDGIYSQWFWEDEWICSGIELEYLGNEPNISCIDVGRYETTRHRSPRFNECFWLLNVPRRSHILIHSGNFAGQKPFKTHTQGCLLPGERKGTLGGQKAILSSRTAMMRLLSTLPDKFVTEIIL